MKKPLKVIGLIDPNWIEKQIQIENNMLFAKSPHYVPKAEMVQSKFKVTQEIKQALASSFHFITSLPKL